MDSLIEAVNQTLKVDEDSVSVPDHAVSLKRIKHPHRAFAIHPEFRDIVNRHLERSDKCFTGQRPLEAKYPFSVDLKKDWAESPVVDLQVSCLASKTLLSLPNMKNSTDRPDRQLKQWSPDQSAQHTGTGDPRPPIGRTSNGKVDPNSLDLRDLGLRDFPPNDSWRYPVNTSKVSEGLSFLHSSVKMIHSNLTPENIILNKSGAWKIMGFDFCNPSVNPSEQEIKYKCKEWDPNLPSLCLPNPEYLAPEYILSVSCDPASDMYSLGVIIHAVYNKGKTIFEVNKQDIYKSFSRQLDQLSRLNPNVLVNIPEEVQEHVKLLLNVTPAVRPDADQMTKIPFFDDVGAVTLQYFDSLFQRDNLQKSQFFKGLPKVLPKLPKRVVVQRILPALTSEFVNPDMVPFVLPNVLLIAEECTKEEYTKLILPDLGPVFRQQEPIQILLIFLQKMDLLLTKTPSDEIKNSVLPMVYRALEAPSIQIQVVTYM
ncbi:unnamed protein product [Ranitomeya imitator]|uniref:Protein kinase domain-containing protein n=1 Tax=Ranitomeya imitator TaxID=111125 RepID=A0ABN9KYM4_9NEOB|nr:unnamed protein product [Ranitomeya imitator]